MVVLASASTVIAVPEINGLTPTIPEQNPQQSIDLTTALMMTTGQNPQVAFARARIEEALAQVDRADALKLPSLRAGVNYNKHEGRIQDVAGTVIDTSRGSFYSGLGANAVGAGSPGVPGIVSQFHFADAIFQPKIAQRTACARQSEALATTNDQLLATALAYTELLRAEQELSVAGQIVNRAEQLQKTTSEFEKAGEGLASDHDRARTELALRRNEHARAEEASAVASARLAELIRWNSDQRLLPSEPQLVPIELVPEGNTPQGLIALALSNRPELAESRHLVGEAVERLKREQHAPLVPSVLLAASYGGLGGGLGSNLDNYGDRLDADAVAFWEVRQLGLGERAAQREARSRITQARMRELATMDRIAREVNETQAQIQARKKQIEISKEAVQAANDSCDKNWERIRNGQGLPIEALQSIQALATAQREYIRAVSEYNMAQFTLQRSLGWPINDAARL
jgi:outer membrane protein TolC